LVSAVKRISREETGLYIEMIGLIGVKEYRRKTAFGQVIALVFLVKGTRGRLRGNKFATEVRVFKSIPHPMIKEQEDMLLELKMIGKDGRLKIDPENNIKALSSRILKVNHAKLWITAR